MIVYEDLHKINNQWYKFEVDVFPCSNHWGHRWFAEVIGRPTDWPEGDESGYWPVHYYTHDYSTFSFRRAWQKSDDAVWSLIEELEADPGLLPDGIGP